MMLNDYSFRIYGQTIQNETLQQLITKSDNFFIIIFLAEFVLKVIGIGFVYGRGTYLSIGWNILDFVVVLSAIFSLLP